MQANSCKPIIKPKKHLHPMKRWLKKIFIVPLVTTLIITSISANRSSWSGMDLSSDEISNSVHFQLQRGSNSLSEFKKIQPILDRFVSVKYSSAYLFNILGKPNDVVVNNSQTQYYYYLTESFKGSRVRLTIQDGNLVSYQMENQLKQTNNTK